jgi:hypothetical protein
MHPIPTRKECVLLGPWIAVVADLKGVHHHGLLIMPTNISLVIEIVSSSCEISKGLQPLSEWCGPLITVIADWAEPPPVSSASHTAVPLTAPNYVTIRRSLL